MKNTYLLLCFIVVIFYSCLKETLDSGITNTIPTITGSSRSAPTVATIYNPIVGNWEIGAFKILCAGASDTTVYPNERGDFVEFRKTDTAFYTYHTTNTTGWSPYKLLDSSTFVLNGDTMRIISNDGVRLTTYSVTLNGGNQQWMTYKKVAN